MWVESGDRLPNLPVNRIRRHAQYAVLTKKLGVKKIYCAAGFSMGAQQVCPV